MKKAQSLFLTVAIAIGIFIFFNVTVVAQQNNSLTAEMTVGAATKAQVIEKFLKYVNDFYISPEVAKKVESGIRSLVQRNEYEKITDAQEFANRLTEDLRVITKDMHLGVRYSRQVIRATKEGEESTAEEKARFENSLKRANYCFEKIERLPGNIGYIDLRCFHGAKSGAETVAAAMTFLANTDALIFDLRQNEGGVPEMVALISSYLFGEKPVHLNSLYWRKGNRTEDFFTDPNLAVKKFPGKDVYILTSRRTFSAGEEFAYNLKNLKRATIIGEATGGGAQPGEPFRLADHFVAFIPTGRAVNPITKTNWEGTGVEPNVKVPKEQALKTAQLIALNKAVEKTKDEELKSALKRTIEQTQKELDEIKK